MKQITHTGKRVLGAICLTIGMLTSQPLLADAEPANVQLSGYDVVSYFTRQKAERGSASHSSEYKGKTYWFSSEQHKVMFVQEPTRYLPQYDGLCAFGMKYGQKVKSDPEAWAIVNGKLYLNTDHSYLEKWKKDTAASIREGDIQWSLLSSDQ